MSSELEAAAARLRAWEQDPNWKPDGSFEYDFIEDQAFIAHSVLAMGLFREDDDCRADWDWAKTTGATEIPRDVPTEVNGVEWKDGYGVQLMSLGWREQLLCCGHEVRVKGPFPTRGEVRRLLAALCLGGNDAD